MRNTSGFWDKHAQGYAKSPIADIPSYEHKLEMTRRYFDAYSTILELGCGTGSTALLHAPYVTHIVATDISEKMLEIAVQKAKNQAVSNVSFVRADASELQLTEPVDMVMTMSLLHLLADKEALIRQIYQWLKPGGVFISSTVCLADSRWRYIRYVAPLARRLGLMPLLSVFSEAQLKQSLINAGFSIDYAWKPRKGLAVFFVARKPMSPGNSDTTAEPD